MRKYLLIAVLLLPAFLCRAGGRRIPAGEAFLEPVTPRDSILIADQVRYATSFGTRAFLNVTAPPRACSRRKTAP